MTPWLLVAGDLTPLGGMDAANHALASYLGRRGAEVHLVTHRAWPDLAGLGNVTVHPVWRPFRRHLLGSPLLALAGTREWRRLRSRDARAIVNGGNCRVPAANWVHYLHAAWTPDVAGSTLRRVKIAAARRFDLAAERAALADARVIVCNSRRTRADLVNRLGVPDTRVEVVYYGTDPSRFAPVTDAERCAARRTLGLEGRPLVGFVGALGDRRKGFDTLFAAWRVLCGRPGWDADLVVVGTGAEQPEWQARAKDAGIGRRMHFLGFRDDVPVVLGALDALVHPARYEAYGLSVHEALCRGVPALVTSSAGVAEKYPSELADLLIRDPDSPGELVERLAAWRAGLERNRALVAPVSLALRLHTWDMMAAEIVACVERAS